MAPKKPFPIGKALSHSSLFIQPFLLSAKEAFAGLLNHNRIGCFDRALASPESRIITAHRIIIFLMDIW